MFAPVNVKSYTNIIKKAIFNIPTTTDRSMKRTTRNRRQHSYVIDTPSTI